MFTPVFGIPQTCQLSVLGLILQDDCRFDCHVRVKLVKANKCLFILRSVRKEGYSQAELDHLFSSIVLPSITYGLLVYGVSETELTAMQCFLDRCYRRKYTSNFFSIKYLLEKQDRKVFCKVSGIGHFSQCFQSTSCWSLNPSMRMAGNRHCYEFVL